MFSRGGFGFTEKKREQSKLRKKLWEICRVWVETPVGFTSWPECEPGVGGTVEGGDE